MGPPYPRTTPRKVVSEPVADSGIPKSGNERTVAARQIAFHSNLVYIFRGFAHRAEEYPFTKREIEPIET
jgi:hypothetical protein